MPPLWLVSVDMRPLSFMKGSLASLPRIEAKLYAFCGVYAEHRASEGGVQLAELWFAQACGASFYHASYRAADGVAMGFHLFYEFGHGFGLCRVRAAYNVSFSF
jgi:hypothetical protein